MPRPSSFFLCLVVTALAAACGQDEPLGCCEVEEALDREALATLDGPRRNGCLSPEELPAWAALPRIDDLQQLSHLVVPYDVGGGRWLKFVLEETQDPWAYFINSAHFGPHWEFTRTIGCDGDVHQDRTVGELGYFAGERAGEDHGAFYFSIDGHPVRDYARVLSAYEILRDTLGVAAELTYWPMDEAQRDLVAAEQNLYDNAPFPVVLERTERPGGINGLNDGVAFGRLRRILPGEIPGPLDIVVLDDLPNDLPLVAGIISATPQTPLAHVNLRAIQDGIPNVYFPEDQIVRQVEPLLGQVVRLQVDGLSASLRSATAEELTSHFDGRRPRSARVPRLDRSIEQIAALDEIGFSDAPAYGAKSANVAELARLGLEANVPHGFAVPVRFYTRFMEETGLNDQVVSMLADPRFETNIVFREQQLEALRDDIRGAPMPVDLDAALDSVHASFEPGVSLRCRSSTNVEDLEDFNGAGLYRSYTHHPSEGRLSKSIQQVYASLWTLRAFEQREFYRVQHDQAAMGVLIHPNYTNEQVNGVAVTDDVVYRWREGVYYLNAQVGEDLVTNPEASSLPEEFYLVPGGPELMYFVVRPSSLAPNGEPLMTEAQMTALAVDLQRIHEHFEQLYDRGSERFSIDVEFKIDAAGVLVIKQARPWIYGRAAADVCVCE